MLSVKKSMSTKQLKLICYANQAGESQQKNNKY